MRYARLLGGGRVVLEERADPKLGPGQVRVRTRVSALCGSELRVYRGEGTDGNLGHEAAGVVDEIGPGVGSLSAGTRVGVSAISGCGRCPECSAGRYTWCDHFLFWANMHAESFVVPAQACHVIPDDVPWDVAVLISGDALGVPYHSARKIASVAANDDVAVFGLRPIGLGAVRLQHFLGRRVIGVDVSAARLELARRLGAAAVIDASTVSDVPGKIHEIAGGRGAAVCIEAAGAAATARQCFAAVRKGGTVLFNGEQSTLELSPSEDLIRRDITAVGSWYYHFHEFADMLALYRRGLNVTAMVTHRYRLDQIGDGYVAMAGGQSGKVIIEYE